MRLYHEVVESTKIRSDQFQDKSTKMGTGRKFVTLQYNIIKNFCAPMFKL